MNNHYRATFKTNKEACIAFGCRDDMVAQRKHLVKVIARIDSDIDKFGDNAVEHRGVIVRFISMGNKLRMVSSASAEVRRTADIYEEGAGFTVALCEASGAPIEDSRTKNGTVGCGYSDLGAKLIATQWVAEGVIPEPKDQVWDESEESEEGQQTLFDDKLNKLIDKHSTKHISQVEGICEDMESIREDSVSRFLSEYKAGRERIEAAYAAAREKQLAIIAKTRESAEAVEGITLVESPISTMSSVSDDNFEWIADLSLSKKQRKALKTDKRRADFRRQQELKKKLHSPNIHANEIEVPTPAITFV